MDIQDILTYAAEAIVCGFIGLMMFDLGNRLSGELLNIFYHYPQPQKAALNPLQTDVIDNQSITSPQENTHQRVPSMAVPL